MDNLTKRDFEDLIDYQEKRRFVNWVLKFLIIIAAGVVIIFGSYIGVRHAYNKALSTATSTTFEIMDDTISGLIEDATGSPAEGIDQINTSIR